MSGTDKHGNLKTVGVLFWENMAARRETELFYLVGMKKQEPHRAAYWQDLINREFDDLIRAEDELFYQTSKMG